MMKRFRWWLRSAATAGIHVARRRLLAAGIQIFHSDHFHLSFPESHSVALSICFGGHSSLVFSTRGNNLISPFGHLHKFECHVKRKAIFVFYI